jgi:hypothetical protein
VGDPNVARRVRYWSLFRLALGSAQIVGAVTSFVLLAQVGVTPLSLGVAVATCVLTTVSVLLFGDRRRRC